MYLKEYTYINIIHKKMATAKNLSLLEKYEACMLLHAAGDAMGYRNGKWEFKFCGLDIHEELNQLGGVDALVLDSSDSFFIFQIFFQ